MRVLVAGGNGFLGSAVIKALLEGGVETGIVSRSKPRETRPQWIRADVTDPAGLVDALRGWNVVVDAVQFPNMPMENPRKGNTFERVDLGGTKNLVDASKTAGIHHYIDLSGAGAAPDAEYHWFRLKWEGEQHIVNSGVPYTIFRPSWVYGPRDVSLNKFLGFARFLPFVPIVGDGKTQIAPLFVDDIGAHVRAAIDKGPANTIFEIGGPQVLTMDEIVRTALRVSGKRRPLFHQPTWLMKAAASVIQLMPGPPLTPDAIDFVTQNGVADTGPLQATFGLRLTPLEEGLATYLAR